MFEGQQFMPIAGFVACALVIFLAGRRLSYYGDIIARRTGMGRAWFGLVLMAAVTSLPELFVGIGSAGVLGSADLAVGDVLGSCAFNLGLLALMDAFEKRGSSLLGHASASHSLAASLGIILLALTGFSLYSPADIVLLPYIGLTSLLFIAVYLVAMRLLYTYEHNHTKGYVETTGSTSREEPLNRSVIMYLIFAGITILAALAIPQFAEELAEQTGLGSTFVGTLFLAASTSLPELAVAITAVRMGAVDLAVGNLLGSNIFNILILSIDDIFYTQGHLLKDASDDHLLSVLACVMMSAVAIIGLTYQQSKKRYLLAWDALVIFGLYVINLLLLYYLTSGQ